MATPSSGLRVALQVALSVVILALCYWLYHSLTEPWKAVERQKELTEMTRSRMGLVRSAMIRYQNVNGRYTTSLDSLSMFVKQDSLLVASRDSVFGSGFNVDSLIFSPRTGSRFLLSVNDTSRVQTYLLRDPDSRDRIGTELPDITLLNASSWE